MQGKASAPSFIKSKFKNKVSSLIKDNSVKRTNNIQQAVISYYFSSKCEGESGQQTTQ